MSAKKHSRGGVIFGLIGSLVIFGFAGWLLLNRQYATDQVSVWAYNLPSSVEAIEERIDFSDKGTFYFYATQPSVDSAEAFNRDCPRQETGSPILGCYSAGRIHIFDIQNQQLDGIEEVTAAHEMLHAVWERKSSDEQKKVGSLLRAEYAKLTDGELKERMDYYARTEPGEFENELHSILGTEYKGLGAELENYYGQFFDDRDKVLALHAKYDSVFKSLQAQSETLFEQLSTLGKSIETRSIQYNTDVSQLSSDIESFNGRADRGEFSSMAQFYNERSVLIARSNQLAADRDSINNDIANYNSLYEEYQSLSSEIEVLNDSIDSIKDLKPAPSL